MDERLQRLLPWLAAAYLALQPTNEMTVVRSALYGAAALVAVILLARSLRSPSPAAPMPPPALTAALLAWSGWSALTWFWSMRPDYTLGQIDRELMDTGLLVVTFYVAARDLASLRVIIGGAIGSLIVLGVLAIGVHVAGREWNAGRWHLGVGPWSTFLVIVAPLLLSLLARPPLGPGRRAGAALAVVAGSILLVTARMTDSRMVWIALAASFATAGVASALRWRHLFMRAPARWAMPFAIAIVAMTVLFADVVQERAKLDFPANTTVAATLASDPRIPLWEHAGPVIGERVWTGHGFGRLILGDRLVREMANPLLTHLHNLFLSQWVQSGAVGLVLFCVLLGTLAGTYVRLIRGADERRVLIGTIGLAMLAGFIVRNLTDDFLFRSNAKEFWLLHAALIGCATALARKRSHDRDAGTRVELEAAERPAATPLPALVERETARESR